MKGVGDEKASWEHSREGFIGHVMRDGEVRTPFRPIEPDIPRGHSGRTGETCKQTAMGLASSVQGAEAATHGEHKPLA